jgi:hypothetical protein
MRYPSTKFLAALLFSCSLVPALAQKDQRGASTLVGPDGFGYTLLDQNATECAFQWVDISATGTAVVFSPSGMDPADDDGQAEITLAQDFTLYGEQVSTLVISSNGYLAPEATSAGEDGGDFSNDCGLPAIPGNATASTARLLVLHDDLTGETGPGTVFQQFFTNCPRTSVNGGDEPCTVIQWQDWAVRGNPDTFPFQAILYHETNQITVQLDPPVSVSGVSATLGIQNRTATSGLAYGCNDGGLLNGQTALCYFEPEHPATTIATDVEVTISSPQDFVIPGNIAVFDIGVNNLGPNQVNLGRITLPLPADTTEASWTCTPARGGDCLLANGAGELDQVVALRPGGAVSFQVRCQLVLNPTGPITGVSSVLLPPLFSDGDPENNSASLALPICPFPVDYWPTVSGWPFGASVLDLLPLLPDCSAKM